MKDKTNIGIFAFAMVLIGEVVGVSFSTGREALSYFADFGPMSFLGMFLAYCLIFLLGYMSYVAARNMDKYTFDWVMTPLGWTPLRIFNLVFSAIFLINALSAMFAGTGSILQSIFGLPYIVGSGIMLIASLITASLSTNKFANIFKYLVPFMIVLAITVSAVCAFDPIVSGESFENAHSDNPLLRTWYLSAFVYFGLQTGPLTQTIIPLAPQVKGKREAAIGNVIGGVCIYALASLLLLATVRNYSIASQGEVPILEMAFAKSTPLGLVYCVAALLAIYSTTSAFLLIIKSIIKDVKPIKDSAGKQTAVLGILSIIGLALSTLGFSTIIDKVYAIIGYASFIGIAGILVNYFYYKKHPVNPDTALDKADL